MYLYESSKEQEKGIEESVTWKSSHDDEFSLENKAKKQMII